MRRVRVRSRSRHIIRKMHSEHRFGDRIPRQRSLYFRVTRMAPHGGS